MPNADNVHRIQFYYIIDYGIYNFDEYVGNTESFIWSNNFQKLCCVLRLCVQERSSRIKGRNVPSPHSTPFDAYY